jgi:hypothetical protein
VRDERGDVGPEEVLALTQPDVPSSRRAVAAMAAVRSAAARYSLASSWPATSVSVSDWNATPSSVSSRLRAAKFSMMPLWMTASLPPSARCGWALVSVGPPCVAHRVCPMPAVAVGIGCSASCATRLPSLPDFFAIATWSRSGPTSATPAES